MCSSSYKCLAHVIEVIRTFGHQVQWIESEITWNVVIFQKTTKLAFVITYDDDDDYYYDDDGGSDADDGGSGGSDDDDDDGGSDDDDDDDDDDDEDDNDDDYDDDDDDDDDDNTNLDTICFQDTDCTQSDPNK